MSTKANYGERVLRLIEERGKLYEWEGRANCPYAASLNHCLKLGLIEMLWDESKRRFYYVKKVA